MAETMLKVRQQQKRDTSENWAKAINFIPKDGEIIVYTDLKKIKVGNGTSTVSNLPFIEAAAAEKLADSHKFYTTGGITSNQVVFNGTQDVNLQVSDVKEAYLSWGGKNLAGTFGPVDACLVSSLGANRFSFMPAAGITVEYSRDGGETWVDYEMSDSNKVGLFSEKMTTLQIGKDTTPYQDKSKWLARVTLNASTAKVYNAFDKIIVYMATGGSSSCYCTIEGKTANDVASGTDTWTTIVNKCWVSGWSGYNIINTHFSMGSSSTHYQMVRFIFGVNIHPATSQYSGMQVYNIYGYGGVGWTTPSSMAKVGHLYDWNADKEAIFPNNIQIPTNSMLTGGMANRAYRDSEHNVITTTYAKKTDMSWIEF